MGTGSVASPVLQCFGWSADGACPLFRTDHSCDREKRGQAPRRHSSRENSARCVLGASPHFSLAFSLFSLSPARGNVKDFCQCYADRRSREGSPQSLPWEACATMGGRGSRRAVKRRDICHFNHGSQWRLSRSFALPHPEADVPLFSRRYHPSQFFRPSRKRIPTVAAASRRLILDWPGLRSKNEKGTSTKRAPARRRCQRSSS